MNNPPEPTDPSSVSQSADTLRALPSLEDTHNQVEAAILRLGQQITAIVPTVSWQWRREDSRGNCMAPYEHTDGERIVLRNYVSDNPIPEQDWQQVYNLAVETAHSLGADNLTVFKDNPSDHDVQFTSDTGTTLRFGSQTAALIGGSTGCRLPSQQ